jgi:NADPH-dependent curcumin reductase CurA
MSAVNRQWLLRSRPQGTMPQRSDFEQRQGTIPPIREGEFLLRNRW